VPTKAGSGQTSSRRSARSRISPAALLVKVTATIERGSTPRARASQAMR